MDNFDFQSIYRYLPYLWEGMQFTLLLTVSAAAGGVVLGTALALARLSSIKPLVWMATTYVNLFRSIPLVLVVFWFYFLVPFLGGWITGASRPIEVGAFLSVFVTFTLFEAAYFAEIVRAGIQSVARGQGRAATALGMSYWQSMFHIILPQALRNMMPVLLNQTIVLFQDTSLVYVLSLTDFFGAATKVAQRDGNIVEMYVFAAVVYFAISYSMSLFVKRMQARRASLLR